MQDSADVAVIGGGAAAAAVLLALAARGGRSPPSVLWVAPAGEDGRGLAYRTCDPSHRLNVRAVRMSARADVPGDFVDYLVTRDGHADPHAFYPRQRYGEYLADRVAECLPRLQAERWSTLAIAASRRGGAWQISGADGQHRGARHLLLAIGPQAPLPAAGVAPALLNQGRYRLDPYAWVEQPRSSTVPHCIWILGSGLTAVDLVLTAAHRYPQAQIHLLSRHGALPATHADAHAPGTDPLQQESTTPTASRLLHLIRRHCEGLADWRDGIDGLRPHTADRWQQWPIAEQRRFLRHVRWAWDRARHRMAPEVAAAIAALLSSGQLTLHQGRLLGADACAETVALTWQARGSSDRREARADLVLQATGLNSQVRNSTMPLLRSLLDQGLVRADALDMGLAVDAEQRLLDGSGQVRGDAHVLGGLARGSRFECTAMPEIRSTAAAIAATLVAGQDQRRQRALAAAVQGPSKESPC